jgi:hypothetical protein
MLSEICNYAFLFLKIFNIRCGTKANITEISTQTNFLFDAAGKMTCDKNKGISAISYNPLDLIQQVTYNLTNFVQYHYTASGSKLRQTVYSDGLASKTTDYAGRFVTKRFEIAYYHKEEKNSAEILKS